MFVKLTSTGALGAAASGAIGGPAAGLGQGEESICLYVLAISMWITGNRLSSVAVRTRTSLVKVRAHP